MVVVEDLVLQDWETTGLGTHNNTIKIVVLRMYLFNVNK